MVDISAFRGYRFNPDKINSTDYSAVLAPPYDVIDSDMRKMLEERSVYNISRITKSPARDSDSNNNNQYTRAAELLKKWIDDEVLIQDNTPTVYVLAQEFTIGSGADKKTLTRSGFIALLKLEEFCSGGTASGSACVGVHQHEETLPKDIEDRLSLCRTTLTNFGQIFSIFPDPERKTNVILQRVMASEPVMTATDDEGVVHKLWLMQEPGSIDELKNLLSTKSIIIADGHHRYKTALKLHEEHSAPDDPVCDSSKFRMMTFVSMMNEGLVILPTHRLVQKVEDFEPSKFIGSLPACFDVIKIPFTTTDEAAAREKMFNTMKEHFNSAKHSFGLYCKDRNYYIITLKETSLMDKIAARSAAWRSLDVSILHQLILEDELGIDKTKLASGSIAGGAYVEYIKDIGSAVQKAIDKVNNQGYQAVFFMNPTRVSEVERVATNHETMPQKSTFFYPKIFTGYVLNKL